MNTVIKHFVTLHVRIALQGIFALMLLISNGCERINSPTAPADPVLDSYLVINTSAGAMLHAILVGETDAADIAQSVQADLDHMSALVDTIALHTGLGIHKMTYAGGNATTSAIRQSIRALDVGPDDVILFYHSGHGGRTTRTATPWPNMYFVHDPEWTGLNLHDVFIELQGKGSRLLLALSDSCNSYVELPASAALLQEASMKGSSFGYQQLFLEGRAAIIASGSLAGEMSYGSTAGGRFTIQFIQAVQRATADDNPNWSDVMERATWRISNAQQPQYAMY